MKSRANQRKSKSRSCQKTENLSIQSGSSALREEGDSSLEQLLNGQESSQSLVANPQISRNDHLGSNIFVGQDQKDGVGREEEIWKDFLDMSSLKEGQEQHPSTLLSSLGAEKNQESEKPVQKCPFCPKFIRTTTFKKHLETHDPNRQKLSCDIGICRKLFSSKKTLRFHQRITHGYNPTQAKITTYECPVEGCGKVFNYKITRDRHVSKMHDPKKPPSMKQSSTTDTILLNTHLDIYQQHTISNSTEANRSLMELITGFNHPRTLSDSNRHLECPASQNCLLRFSRLYDLNRHLAATHPDFLKTS